MADWLTSLGGPFVLLPRSQVARWRGSTDGEDVTDDYAAACGVSGFVGLAIVNGTSAIVLNDEPLDTTVVSVRGQPAVLRWIAAPNERSVFAALDDFDPQAHVVVSTVAVEIEELQQVMFDAAIGGLEQQESMTLHFPRRGKYLIKTYKFRHPNGSEVLVHIFGPAE